jgi:hypothetical protein
LLTYDAFSSPVIIITVEDRKPPREIHNVVKAAEIPAKCGKYCCAITGRKSIDVLGTNKMAPKAAMPVNKTGSDTANAQTTSTAIETTTLTNAKTTLAHINKPDSTPTAPIISPETILKNPALLSVESTVAVLITKSPKVREQNKLPRLNRAI